MSVRQKISQGVLWTTIERFATQIIQFTLSILIARILSPSDFGVIAIIMIFINLSQVLVDSGFGKSLIQKSNPTEKDSSTVFFFNLFISFCLFGVLWISAPGIAAFYKNTELIKLLRVSSVVIVINAFIIVHQALMSIKFDFKRLAIANFISTVIGGITGLIMAIKGYDVWALVGQTIMRSLILTVSTIILFKWFPASFFSIKSFKELYKYGINIFATSFINAIVNQLSSILIGKLYKPAQLGFYSKGSQISLLPYYTIYSIINRTLFPALVSIKDDHEKLVSVTKEVLKYVSFISVPVFFFLGMNAHPIVQLLLTDKWLPAVPIIQIFSFSRMISMVASVNVDLLNAIGRSDLSFKQQLYKMVIRIVLLLAAVKFGIIWLAVADLIVTVIHYFINCYYPGKMMKYGAFSQIKDISPIIISAIISVFCGFIASYFLDSSLLKLLISLGIASITYFPLLLLFKQRSMLKSIRTFTNLIRQQ